MNNDLSSQFLEKYFISPLGRTMENITIFAILNNLEGQLHVLDDKKYPSTVNQIEKKLKIIAKQYNLTYNKN